MLTEDLPLIEDQCRMVMLMVILRAVEDYQMCIASGYIENKTVATEKVYSKFKSNTGRLGLGLSEPSDIQSLIYFFHKGGLEVTLEIARLDVDSDCIKRALALPYGSISGAFFGTTEANFSKCGTFIPVSPDIENLAADLGINFHEI